MEHLLAKEGVAGSIPVSRSKKSILSDTFFVALFLGCSCTRPASCTAAGVLAASLFCRFPLRALLLSFSCFLRVQIATFLLLYPADALFPASHGYRRPFSFSCTRPTPFLPLPTGTDDHFSSPVPGRRFIFRFPRVQMTVFLLLYPSGTEQPPDGAEI